MPTDRSEDILAVMAFMADHEMTDGTVWWRCDSEYAPVTFLLNCSDLFFWACSDAEELKVADLPALKRAIDDCEAAVKHCGAAYGPSLWVSRVRKMRPQGPWYPKGSEGLWPLFDACGPEREPGVHNPRRPTTETAAL